MDGSVLTSEVTRMGRTTAGWPPVLVGAQGIRDGPGSFSSSACSGRRLDGLALERASLVLVTRFIGSPSTLSAARLFYLEHFDVDAGLLQLVYPKDLLVAGD